MGKKSERLAWLTMVLSVVAVGLILAGAIAAVWDHEQRKNGCAELRLYCDTAKVERNERRIELCGVIDYCAESNRTSQTCAALLRAVQKVEGGER